MRRLRNLLTSDDGQELGNLALILVLIAIAVIVAFLSLGGQITAVSRGVGSSV